MHSHAVKFISLRGYKLTQSFDILGKATQNRDFPKPAPIYSPKAPYTQKISSQKLCLGVMYKS